MEGHGRGEYSPLERSRLLAPGMDSHGNAGSGGGGGGGGDSSSSAGGAGSAGSGLTSVSEFSSRTATPTPLTSLAAQYSRYGLPPALPAHSYTLMSSFLTSAHSAEARKTLLPEFQHYWGEGVQRYLMSGLYPPYSPLFPPTAESLSLLGAGVACVAGSAGAGAGPAPAHHTAHYQRLLEMQKAEAYLASMSAAASHHPALYALPPSALPQLVEPPLPLSLATSSTTSSATSSSASPAHSSNQAPLSLVKQEPRDLSCAEKVAKQSERRAMGVKVDLDQHHARLTTSQSLTSAGGGSRASGSVSSSAVWSAPLKEPKLSPSAPAVSPETSSRHDRRHTAVGAGSGVRVTPAASLRNNSHSETTSHGTNNPLASTTGSSDSISHVSTHRDDGSRHNTHGSGSRRSATPRPGTTPLDKTSNNSSIGTGVGGQNYSVSNSNASGGHGSRKSSKNSNKQKTHSARSSPSSLSPRSAMDMSIPSVPTKLAPPIALAIVQHDGIVLSALASPSSAAASSAASKNFSVKQVVARGGPDDGGSNTDKRGGNTPSSSSVRQADGGTGTSSSSLTAPAHSSSCSTKDGTNASRTGTSHRNSSQDRSEAKVSSDENSSDIVVDSTESDDVMSTSDATTPATTPATGQPQSQAHARLTAAAAIKSEQERAIEETIQRVLAHEDGCSDTVDTRSMDNLPASGPSRAGSSGLTPSTVSSTTTRTVYAKTQSVPTITSAGAVLLSSSVVSQAATSALPYYHTLYSKPQGTKKVHATTFVPEVGVFKGPSLKVMGKHAAPTTSLAAPSFSASPWHASSEFPRRGEPRPLSVAVSPRLSDGTPSPSLLSPNREVGSLLTSPSHRMPSPGVSPSVSHVSVETPVNMETASSIDSASVYSHSAPSVRSHSVTSAHSGLELNDSDDTSENEESALVIDDDDDFSEANAMTIRKPAGLNNEAEKLHAYPQHSGERNEHTRVLDCFISQNNPLATISATASLPNKISQSPKMRHKKLMASNQSPVHTETSSYSLSNQASKTSKTSAPSGTENSSASFPVRQASLHASNLPRIKHAATCADLRKAGADSKLIVSRRTLAQHKGDVQTTQSSGSDMGISRCISAPPSSVDLQSHKIPKATAPSHSGLLAEDKMDKSAEHTGGSIPVGIAVAQIRPHHVHQARDASSVSGAGREHTVRHASPSGASRARPPPASHLTRSSDGHQAGLTQGHSVAPSTWPGQASQFPSSQSQAGHPTRQRYPVSAPEGFKFTVDPSTGQVFLVHSEDFEEQTSHWPVNNQPVPSGATPGQVKSNTSLPTVTVHSPEPRQVPSGNISVKDGRQANLPHKPAVQSSQDSSHKPEGSINNVVSSLPLASAVSSGLLWAPAQSRGCSPILCEEFSSPLSLLSTLSSLSSRKPTTCSVGIQVGEAPGRGRKKRSSMPKHLSSDQGVQTSPLTASTSSHHYHPQVSTSLPPSSSSSTSSSSKALNPLPAHCQPLEVKVGEEGSEHPGSCLYNPFTDPQILQAAHGLELLSTLAEKRPKCSSSSAASSLDDPKHIYPSPSDSYDTLSPTVDPLAEAAVSKNGHPRREVRRELSPKWTRPKKEPQDGASSGDFKPPPELELAHDLDVRVKLVEVQRQYKEKQRELAKLQSKKLDSSQGKSWKRGPGRPPKKKTPLKKSDDDSSSSSSRPKDGHHQQQKKKRPAEELVDRIYRKLAPDKPNKVSRSIHYVKSKTGPFFRRKSASSSLKRNKDLFGIDPSMWPSYSERKHQEKVKHGKDKYKVNYTSHLASDHNSHYTFKSKGHKSSHAKDTGNIFANLQKSCASGEFLESASQSSKSQVAKCENIPSRLDLSTSSQAVSLGTIKTESNATSARSSHLSGVSLLAKFALTTAAPTPAISAPVTISSSTLTAALASASGRLPSISTAFSTHTVSSSCSNSALTSQTMNRFISSQGLTGGLYSSSSTTISTPSRSATFGSISSFMTEKSAGFFSSTNGTGTGMDKSKAVGASSSSNHENGLTPSTVTATTTTTMSTTLSTGTAATVIVTSANTTIASSTSTTPAVVVSSPGQPQRRPVSSTHQASESSGLEQDGGSSCAAAAESSSSKRKAEEDSDAEGSDESPNKKRKPGRPRKINPEKSSGGTETIWAKKSCHLQENNPNDSRRSESDLNTPLFLDEDWSRRRSERIFLHGNKPETSPSVTTTGYAMSTLPPSAVSPRSNSSEQHVWKLSNFMPKSKKPQESKCSPSGEPEIKTEKRDEPTPGPSYSGKPGKPQEMPIKKSTSSTKEDPDVLSSSLSLPPSPAPQKSKRGRKPKDDKSKVKKVKEREATSSSPSPPKLVKKEGRSEELARMKQQKSKNLHSITQRVKKKFSKANKQAEENSKGKSLKDRRKGKDKKKEKDYDSLDGEGPPTPEPRCCKLTSQDLREGLRVLYHNDGLFYEGTVKALQPPDIYGVLTAGQRGSRPHILCQEEVLKEAVLDVKPGSKRYLPVGTRVCAFWSQQFSCLYPGTVARSSSSSSDSSTTVSVDFDDEDSGRIPIEHIRLLPADFPIIEYEPDPLDNLPKKRRTRTESDASESERPQKSKNEPKRNACKTDSDENEENESDNENDGDGDEKSGEEESDSTDSSTELLYWQWHGSPVRKPGQKGKIFAKGKRVYYKAITRASEVINVGDAAIFVSTGRADFPYIGNIENLWQTASGNMMVKVRWYYHPEETNSGKKLGDLKNGLFTSPHMDENDVQTIAHKCEVLTPAQFRKRGQAGESHVYFCAGHYDPVTNALTLNSGVS